MKNILFALLTLVVFSACKKDETYPDPPQIFGFDDYDEAAKHLGVYVHMFDIAEGGMYMRESEYMNRENTSWEVGGVYRDAIGGENGNGGDYYINDVKFVYNGAYYTLEGVEDRDNEVNRTIIDPLYGTGANFRLVRNGQEVYNIDYYIPKSLEITNLDLEPNHIEIGTENLTLEWEADTNNENGVVIYLFFNGVDMSDSSIEEETHKAIKVEDTGSTTISRAYFDGIPVGATFSMWVIRGNARLVNAPDDRRYTVHTVSEHQLSCKIVE